MAKYNPDGYDYFVVIDFEATCERDKKIKNQEIIEFPALKVNAENFEIEAEFHHYVRPLYNPKLTPFCLELTSVTQASVDSAKEFTEVFEDFKTWIDNELNGKKYLFVTCGDWDLKIMLRNQCTLSGKKVPAYCSSWMNIMKVYEKSTGNKVRNLDEMIDGLQLSHTGVYHSGIDDSRNIVKVLEALAIRGIPLNVTTSR